MTKATSKKKKKTWNEINHKIIWQKPKMYALYLKIMGFSREDINDIIGNKLPVQKEG